jgi:hypothetical protein
VIAPAKSSDPETPDHQASAGVDLPALTREVMIKEVRDDPNRGR